jgi:hypothetical protein
MKYLMLVCAAPDADLSDLTEDDLDIERWLEETGGRRLDGNRLRPVGEAKTVKVRRGELLTMDGPFAETKELIAGYDILDCANLDEAVEIASKHPVAKFGTIEVREFWEMD